MNTGKLIVIDGVDGAGKSTQSKLLSAYLTRQGVEVESLKFPRYDTFFGQIVTRFLAGEFGNIDQVSPYLASIVYALDRQGAREHITTRRSAGMTIVMDRYISSNMAHQASKFTDASKQEDFLTWIATLEYDEMQVPREDHVLWLDMPVEIAQGLITKRSTESRIHSDIHETDLEYQKRTRELYKTLSERYDYWTRIECVDQSGALLTPEAIHMQIIGVLR